MTNFLNQGYEIEREDGTRQTYFGWDISEIRVVESCRQKYRILHMVYKIENEFHKYTYDTINGTFRDHNEAADEITEIETAHGIAHYIWTLATEGNEDSVLAYRHMAVDIFGSFDYWRAMTFWHMMKEFERDAEFLKEVYR